MFGLFVATSILLAGDQPDAAKARKEPTADRTAATAADDLNDDERAYLTKLIQVRDVRADELRREISQLPEPPKLKRSARHSKPKPGTKAYREKEAAELAEENSNKLRSELERLETGEEIPVLGSMRVRQGEIGQLGHVKVTQVIGPDEMLVEYHRDFRLWVQGVSTKNYVDDQNIWSLSIPVFSTGPRATRRPRSTIDGVLGAAVEGRLGEGSGGLSSPIEATGTQNAQS